MNKTIEIKVNSPIKTGFKLGVGFAIAGAILGLIATILIPVITLLPMYLLGV